MLDVAVFYQTHNMKNYVAAQVESWIHKRLMFTLNQTKSNLP